MERDISFTGAWALAWHLIAPSRGIESPVPTGVHTLAWTAAERISWEPSERKKLIAFGADDPSFSEPTDVVTVLHIFAKYLSLYLHIFTCTHRGTHTQAHMYNQHTRGMETTRHRSLVERGGRKALLETLHTHKKNENKKNVRENPIFTNLKEKIRAHRASSKATRLFLTK